MLGFSIITASLSSTALRTGGKKPSSKPSSVEAGSLVFMDSDGNYWVESDGEKVNLFDVKVVR